MLEFSEGFEQELSHNESESEDSESEDSDDEADDDSHDDSHDESFDDSVKEFYGIIKLESWVAEQKRLEGVVSRKKEKIRSLIEQDKERQNITSIESDLTSQMRRIKLWKGQMKS